MLSPSATNRKSRGDKGNPCQRSLLYWKKGEVDPFMNTAKETKEMQLMTQFIKGRPNPK